MTGRKALRATGFEKPPWHKLAAIFRPQKRAQKLAPKMGPRVRHARWRDAPAAPLLAPASGHMFGPGFGPVDLATFGLIFKTSAYFFLLFLSA